MLTMLLAFVWFGLACRAFSISETCYRYQAKLSDDNALIAEQLIELTEENTDWGFGLYFSYLRHVENHILKQDSHYPQSGLFVR